MALPKPVSRADMYLSYLNYTKGLTLANLPKPVSRADMYLYNLCINRGIGGGSGGSNVTLNGEPQTNFNFIGDENSTISALQIGEKTYSFNGGSSGDTTDNVVDRAGRTQEQINRTFYKRMCKEIPSPSGEPITVKNGEEGYVLSAEIKGNTQLFKRAKGSQDEWIVIPNGEGRDTVAFEYKLDSTQAIISNNGEPYPIYASEEDKANKKVISLRGTSETKDTLEIKEDGIGVWTRNLVTQAIKYSDNWQTYDKYADGYKTYKVKQKEQIMNVNSICICDKLPHQKWITAIYPTPALAGEYITVHGDAFVISVKEETAPTLDDFKNYLKQIGDIIITYPTKTPTTTPIPKELVPTIQTQQTNILEVVGKVKASSFKVTLPVDRIAELTARLEAVESKTNTQPVNTAFVDETYAKSVNKIEEVIK